jgi:hypothetical protein
MSLVIKPKNTQIICNHKGKQLFEFPNSTLLDNIFSELWNNILRYMNYYPFAVGKSEIIYPGYRSMTIEEFNSNKKILCDYYWKNRGLISLDTKIGNNINAFLMVQKLSIMFKISHYPGHIFIRVRGCDKNKIFCDSLILNAKKMIIGRIFNEEEMRIWTLLELKVPDI